jgi:uncharacterized protein (DUF1810 family)
MKTILIVLVVVVVLVLIFTLAKKRFVATEAKVKMADIPAIFEKLRAVGKNGSFAVFIFMPPGKASPDEAINVQFSMERGQIGFDWVLLGPANIRDKEKFVQLAGRLGYKVVDREMNNVKYLRVDEGDLPSLCEASIRDLYSIPSDAEMGMIPEGFKWP